MHAVFTIGHGVRALEELVETLVVHLLAPGRRETHRLYDESEPRDGKLYLCGSLVA